MSASSGLVVRPCNTGDSSEALVALSNAAGASAVGFAPADAEMVAGFRVLQEEDSDAFVVAVEGEVLAGMCACAGGDEGVAVLHHLAVHPSMRRRGVGGRLEAHAIGFAAQRNAGMIRTAALVDSRNTVGVAFLQAAGWHPAYGASLRMWRCLDGLPEVEMPAGYTVRTYDDGDADAFVRIKNAAFAGKSEGGGVWTRTDFEHEYFGSRHFRPDRIFFAVCDGDPVGTTTAWTAEHERREVGLIHWVAVAPEHQQKGLGWALNVLVLHKLRDLGYTEAILNTNERLESAVRLYHRLGFREVCRRARYQKPVAGQQCSSPDAGST